MRTLLLISSIIAKLVAFVTYLNESPSDATFFMGCSILFYLMYMNQKVDQNVG